MSNYLRLHELKHARLPCPSLSPRLGSDSCPLRQWCHLTISFSVTPFSSCPHSFPAPRSFPMLSLCIKLSKYWSFSFSISPSYEYSGLISFRIDWFHLLDVQETLKSLLSTTVQKHQFFGAQPSFWSSSHSSTWLMEKLDGLVGLVGLDGPLSSKWRLQDCAESHSNLHLSFLGCLLSQSISEGANVEALTGFIFLSSQITADSDLSQKF